MFKLRLSTLSNPETQWQAEQVGVFNRESTAGNPSTHMRHCTFTNSHSVGHFVWLQRSNKPLLAIFAVTTIALVLTAAVVIVAVFIFLSLLL